MPLLILIPMMWLLLFVTGRGLEVGISSPCWPFKFGLLPGFEFGGLGLKERLLPCQGVEHSLQLCPAPPHPQHIMFFLSCLGLWNVLEEYLSLPLGLNAEHPLVLVKFRWSGWLQQTLDRLSLCNCLIWWFRTSLCLQWISICPYYCRLSSNFRHTTSECLCFSLSWSHYQLAYIGSQFII